MNVLVINAGSSSLKCQVYDLPDGKSLAKAVIERVGQETSKLKFQRDGVDELVEEGPCPTHLDGVRRVLELLHQELDGAPAIGLEAVGHRVVHAGEAFTGSVPVTAEVLDALEACSDLAPLHNPPNLNGIRACLQELPEVPAVCVFDNALHHTLAPEVWHYALPQRHYRQDRIRRYGFHGVAIRSIAGRVEALVGRPLSELRIVSLMLGSGCTANALKYGESISVSTGFTPLEGLVQSTRCGDLDPGIVLYLLRHGYSAPELNDLLNRHAGLLGVSGISPDMRDLEADRSERSNLALDLFMHRATKYVGGYTADLGGLDVLAFGGGVGQNGDEARERICAPLGHLGIQLEPELNRRCIRGVEGIISTDDSPVKVVVASVDEELVIAQDTFEVLGGA